MKIIRKTMKKIKKNLMEPRTKYFMELLKQKGFHVTGEKQMEMFENCMLLTNGKITMKEVRIPKDEFNPPHEFDSYTYFIYKKKKIEIFMPSTWETDKEVKKDFERIMAL